MNTPLYLKELDRFKFVDRPEQPKKDNQMGLDLMPTKRELQICRELIADEVHAFEMMFRTLESVWKGEAKQMDVHDLFQNLLSYNDEVEERKKRATYDDYYRDR